jgi:glutamate racemase
MNDNRPIGVFDSGVGGLTVLKKLVQEMPNEDYIYFGDTARVPYGEKTKDQLIGFSREILDWYKKNNVKMVLMACNTSSSVALDAVKNDYDFPILGLIRPAAEYTAKLEMKRIGIIATSATIKSNAYKTAINNIDPDKEIFQVPCPGLVEIVESGKVDSQESIELVSKYIKPLIENKAEKIILGCTHYPYFSDIINKLTNKTDILIDPGTYITIAAKEKLNKIGTNNSSKGSIQYFVSSNPEIFVQVGHKFFNDCKQAKEINHNIYYPKHPLSFRT